MLEVFGPPKVYDVIASLENNGAPFATVHVGVRTTLLLAFYAPWRTEALSLMGVSLLTALLAAFLLSNLALRPMEQISRQLDRWTTGRRNRDASQSPPICRTRPRRSPPRLSRLASACAMWKRCSPH